MTDRGASMRVTASRMQSGHAALHVARTAKMAQLLLAQPGIDPNQENTKMVRSSPLPPPLSQVDQSDSRAQISSPIETPRRAHLDVHLRMCMHK